MTYNLRPPAQWLSLISYYTMTKTCKRNIKNGYNTCTYSRKNKNYDGVYQGNYKNHKMNGKGKYTWINKDQYVGFFKNNNLNGQGTIKTKTKICKGKYKNGKLNGSGKCKYKTDLNGNQIISGIYKNDFLDKGKIVFLNDKQQKQQMGTFKRKIENGRNVILLNGQGEMQYKNGNVVKGMFKDNKLNGKGEMRYNGIIEKGTFKDDVLNGNGLTKFIDGDVNRGIYKNGKLNGPCMKIWKDSTYKGYCKNGEKHGKGTRKYKNGTIEKGIWKNDKLT